MKENHYKPILIEEKTKIDKNHHGFSYASPRGTFLALDKNFKILQKHSCRETFSPYFTVKITKIGLHVPEKEKEKEKIADFFAKIEKKLKLDLNERLVFQHGGEDMLIIFISPWWRTNLLRRQILTALIRTSLIKRRTIGGKLAQSPYFQCKNLRKAFDLFLSGKNRLKKGGITKIIYANGWKNTFSNKDNHEILF